MSRFAIIGFGCAGYNALRAIREAGCTAEVDIFSDSSLPPANPMLTTYYVKGKIPYEAMFPFGTTEEILERYPAHFYPGVAVTALDAAAKRLTLSNGEERAYDKILIASGAAAVQLPVGDLPAERICTMRTVEDAVRLKEILETRPLRRVLVVGASMVGIKIVELMQERGVKCVLSDLAPHIFAAAAYETVSERIERCLADQSVELHFGVKTEAAVVEGDTCRITFSDGSETAADLVVMCVGTRADIAWVPAEIARGRAIIVDETMQTSVPGIYAAGDCCEGTDLMLGATRNIGLYASAYVQGETAGRHMAGEDARCEGNILHNITHFMGMDFVSFGDKNLPGERVVFLDEGSRYMEATVKDGVLQCINILDDYALSGVVKHCILRHFEKNAEPLKPEEQGLLAKSGLPNALIRILEGMVE